MRARGFSLVEFMVAMTIGLFLVAGLVYLIAETSRSRAEIERSSRQIENGRYAIDRIAEDVRHVGFWGEAPLDPSTLPVAAALPNPCNTAIATNDTGLVVPIQAYAGAGTLPSALNSCLSALSYKPNTDVLVIRHASTDTYTTAQAAAGTNGNSLFLQTGLAPPAGENAFVHRIARGSLTGTFDLQRINGGTDPAFTYGTAPLRRYITHIYFISTLDESGASIPTLRMLELGTGPAWQVFSIAEGIEEMRFDFGLDAAATKDGVSDNCGATALVRFTKCDGSALASGADEVDHWTNIVAVQVYIVARNAETSPAYWDDKVYNLGLAGTAGPYNNNYRRHAYTTFVRLNNVSMPRERN